MKVLKTGGYPKKMRCHNCGCIFLIDEVDTKINLSWKERLTGRFDCYMPIRIDDMYSNDPNKAGLAKAEYESHRICWCPECGGQLSVKYGQIDEYGRYYNKL